VSEDFPYHFVVGALDNVATSNDGDRVLNILSQPRVLGGIVALFRRLTRRA
jgi:hypothetical protein